jgi:sn-glycerol 3-phosphate transport system substrate-binding protein
MKLRALIAAVILVLIAELALPAAAQVKLQFYYPVGVAGPLARIIEGYVKEWNQSHPQI